MKLTKEQRESFKNRILLQVSKFPHFSYQKIAESCGLTRQTVSKYIEELKEEGRLSFSTSRFVTDNKAARTYDDSMFINTFEHEYTWLNGFMRNVRRYADSPAVIDPETKREWTYSQLNGEVNRFASALKNHGVSRNDVVMCAVRNCPEFAVSYIAPRKTGSIILEANYNAAPGETALLIEQNRPKVIIYSTNVMYDILQALALCSYSPELFILCDNIEKEIVPEGHILYEDFIAGESGEEPELDFVPHIYDEVLRLCTSGTTSAPKTVPVNDINEVLCAHDVIMQYPLNHFDRTLNMTPWFHRGGCHCAGPGPVFYVGAALVISRKFNPRIVLDWVKKYKLTFLIGSPANLEMLCRAQEVKKRDISGLHGLVTMGAPLSRTDCLRYAHSLHPNIFNGYGTTETFWNSFLKPQDLPERAGSVGLSCIDDEVRVVKLFENRRAEPDEMAAHDRMEEGEIIVKAPGKSTYTYSSDETDQKFYNGWYYTGDIGTWDEDWVVTVRGRKDDMMVVSGENIYPSQVEETLKSYSKVKDCIVTSVPDKVRGEVVVAYVVPEDESLSIRDLIYYCNQTPMLSKYKRPRYFAIINEIPLSITGKKLQRYMKSRALKDLETGFLRRS